MSICVCVCVCVCVYLSTFIKILFTSLYAMSNYTKQREKTDLLQDKEWATKMFAKVTASSENRLNNTKSDMERMDNQQFQEKHNLTKNEAEEWIEMTNYGKAVT